MSHSSPAREEYEVVLQPLLQVPLERELPWGSASGNKAGCARA